MSSRVILVTGASSGIGEAIAHQCAKDGDVVLAVARRHRPLDKLARHIPNIHPLAMDVSTEAGARRVVAAARKLGPLRGIVHCAGLFKPAPLEKLRLADWDAMFALNVRTAAILLQAALPDLRNGGVFVAIGSTAGLRPVAGYSAYCASKGALATFVQTAALELAPQGIRVHCVAPGIVETPMVPHAAQTASLHPLGRAGRPSDIVPAVRLLLSDEAAWMTGVVLPVDGGISLT